MIPCLQYLFGGEQCVPIHKKLHRIVNLLQLAVYWIIGVDILLKTCFVVMHVRGGDLAVAPHQVLQKLSGSHSQITCVEVALLC